MPLSITSSLRMDATSATFFGLPAGSLEPADESQGLLRPDCPDTYASREPIPGRHLRRPGRDAGARPHVGDEAAGALGTEGEVGFDLLHPAHYLDLTSRTVLFARPADGQFNPAGQFPSVTFADGALCGAVRGDGQHDGHVGVRGRLDQAAARTLLTELGFRADRFA